ncbi:Hypothetical predicted protein [Prunus dulcis]|uniref:Uncharacterized protein n=1 Tax=Prunus dulcis TaxID=3755 RepID=A0A5E4F0P3_PRUDU|nr:aquaporin PIP1-3-like [Prunus dulcis]VVA19458.1 Hypothetical predicted protein [Prunus dulcis]
MSAQTQDEGKDYKELPPAPRFEPGELTSWSFYRAGVAPPSFFLYITILTVKGFEKSCNFELLGGGANSIAHGYTKGSGLGAEIVGTFVLVYTVFSATDAKRSTRDSHVPILAPLLIGFAVFLAHLATIPIIGTSINPARSLGAAIIYNKKHAWDNHKAQQQQQQQMLLGDSSGQLLLDFLQRALRLLQ